MATWVMSDLHGNCRKYREAMDTICHRKWIPCTFWAMW